jgi:AraC-like DNA-binding protein
MDGTGALVQDGQERTLRAGSVWWFRTDLNYTLSFPDPVRMVAVAVPAERSQRLAEHLRSGHLPATDPVAASLGPTLERLEDAYGSLSPMTRHRFTEHLLDTVDTIWMHAAELDGRPTLVAQAMSVIESRLADPELDPSHIARALHVSVRSLHAAFAEVGMSIAATIRSSRLEHCRKDLADPLLSHRAVGAIGAAWGFASPSHFTSLFRARFGMTPTAYRKAQPTLVG